LIDPIDEIPHVVPREGAIELVIRVMAGCLKLDEYFRDQLKITRNNASGNGE
jgi:hypothetical protein